MAIISKELFDKAQNALVRSKDLHPNISLWAGKVFLEIFTKPFEPEFYLKKLIYSNVTPPSTIIVCPVI